jgi:hypothetical protein
MVNAMSRSLLSAMTAAVLGILSLFFVAAWAAAAPPAHSPEACVCHIDGKGGPDERDGSKATNATICVQTFDEAKRWCNVTIECLRNANLPGCTAPSKIIPSLPTLYVDHLQSLEKSGFRALAPFQQGVRQIDILSRDPPPILKQCVASYEKQSSLKPIESGSVSCGVSDANKWLFIDVLLQPSSSVRFLFAPPQ